MLAVGVALTKFLSAVAKHQHGPNRCVLDDFSFLSVLFFPQVLRITVHGSRLSSPSMEAQQDHTWIRSTAHGVGQVAGMTRKDTHQTLMFIWHAFARDGMLFKSSGMVFLAFR